MSNQYTALRRQVDDLREQLAASNTDLTMREAEIAKLKRQLAETAQNDMHDVDALRNQCRYIQHKVVLARELIKAGAAMTTDRHGKLYWQYVVDALCKPEADNA